MEFTLANVFARRGNLLRWLRRHDAPEEIRELAVSIDGALGKPELLESLVDVVEELDMNLPFGDEEVVMNNFSKENKSRVSIRRGHWRDPKGINYLRDTTHAGNSIIAYHDRNEVAYGSITEIWDTQDGCVLEIKPYAMLPPGVHDNFKPYTPDFPAKTLSTKQTRTCRIPASSIKCHCARYKISDDSVVLVELSEVSPVTMTNTLGS